MLGEIKLNQLEILHVREMIFLELKIFHVRLNKIEKIGNTSCKKNEIAGNENTSINLK